MIIEFAWNTETDGCRVEDVSLSLEEILKAAAFERAYNMYKDGFTSGELVEVYDEIIYSGWWSIYEETIDG